MQEEARRSVCNAAEAICDGFRQVCDFSYAILPKDLAHAVGDLNKAVLTEIRNLVDCEIQWTDDRVAGGDRMREEWRQQCRQQSGVDATTEI